MRSAEAQRAALIGQLDICLVEGAPANLIPENEQPPRADDAAPRVQDVPEL
jgi:hypothetical protein